MRLIVDSEHINEMQADTITRLIETLRDSYEIDIMVHKRKDGVDKYFQADWLKHARLEYDHTDSQRA
jgi:hypothetical protein